jgi:hypothetical protein
MYSQNESNGVFMLNSPPLLSPGSYKVTVRLKVSSRTANSILLLDLIANNSLKLAERKISGYQINNAHQWQSFTADFNLRRPTFMQIMGSQVTNTTEVYLDYVQILQTSGRR